MVLKYGAHLPAPAKAAYRAVPCRATWEGDLLLGKAGRSAIGSVVERRSRYVMLLNLPDGRTAEHVRRALVDRMTTLPEQLRCTRESSTGALDKRWTG